MTMPAFSAHASLYSEAFWTPKVPRMGRRTRDDRIGPPVAARA